MRCGCGAVAFIFSIFLKPVLYALSSHLVILVNFTNRDHNHCQGHRRKRKYCSIRVWIWRPDLRFHSPHIRLSCFCILQKYIIIMFSNQTFLQISIFFFKNSQEVRFYLLLPNEIKINIYTSCRVCCFKQTNCYSFNR